MYLVEDKCELLVEAISKVSFLLVACRCSQLPPGNDAEAVRCATCTVWLMNVLDDVDSSLLDRQTCVSTL